MARARDKSARGARPSVQGQDILPRLQAEADALIDKAAGMPDKAAREKAYQDAEQLMMNDMPRIPVYHGQSFFVIKPNLQGQYHPAILGGVPRAKYAFWTK